jgi:hypothetical protein
VIYFSEQVNEWEVNEDAKRRKQYPVIANSYIAGDKQGEMTYSKIVCKTKCYRVSSLVVTIRIVGKILCMRKYTAYACVRDVLSYTGNKVVAPHQSL